MAGWPASLLYREIDREIEDERVRETEKGDIVRERVRMGEIER